MLQSETEKITPGLLVFIHAVTLWLVYTVLVSGPCAEAPWLLNSNLPI